MDLDIFDAFRAAGVPDDKARGAIDAIHGLIDQRYVLHAERLATREDLANVREDVASVRVEVAAVRSEIANVRAEVERAKGELAVKLAGTMTAIADTKSELIRWCVGSIFSSVAMFAAITRLLAH